MFNSPAWKRARLAVLIALPSVFFVVLGSLTVIQTSASTLSLLLMFMGFVNMFTWAFILVKVKAEGGFKWLQ